MGSIEDVVKAIGKVQKAKKEWARQDRRGWNEPSVRYAMVDPIIRALGWDTEDPKQCHPEWPYPGGEGQVDYALFPETAIEDLANSLVPPVIIIEAKGYPDNLCNDRHMNQLNKYARAKPRMKEGWVVLTNGIEWWLYEAIGMKRDLRKKPDRKLHIIKLDVGEVAKTLYNELGRHRWS